MRRRQFAPVHALGREAPPEAQVDQGRQPFSLEGRDVDVDGAGLGGEDVGGSKRGESEEGPDLGAFSARTTHGIAIDHAAGSVNKAMARRREPMPQKGVARGREAQGIQFADVVETCDRGC